MLNIIRSLFLGISFCGCFAALWLTSCSQGSSGGFSQCPESVPSAIFGEVNREVISHQFDMDNEKSTEYLVLEGGIIIELIQTGCSPMPQHFTFYWPAQATKFNTDDIAGLSAEVMLWIGNLHPGLGSLRAWSTVFQELEGSLQNGETFDVDDRYSARAHFMPGEMQNILYIELTMV